MKARTILLLAVAVLIGFSAQAQQVKVDVSKSVLKWNGKKVTGEHYGKIALKEGSFKLENNKIVGGKFIIDMNSITDEDLTDPGWNSKLIGHLKSDDFFGVEKYPEAVLELISSTPLVGGKTKVKANLTIKGITNPIEFEAQQNGNQYTALITVDRSKYNVRYGSSSFFEGLGDKVIYDNFTLDVNLFAMK